MRPYYAGVLGRRNHNHNSSSAHTGTKARITITSSGRHFLRRIKGNWYKEKGNKKGTKMNRHNL